MHIVKKVGSIISYIFTAMLAVLLICNVYTIGVRYFTGEPQPVVFGWSWAVVISGSMEPEIKVNALVIAHEEEKYKVGDVITFKSGTDIVTHRIIGEDNGKYVTKGDANNTNDDERVSKDDILGKAVYCIPKVGLIIGYLRTPLGMMSIALCGVLLIKITQFLNMQREEKGEAS